MSFNRICFESYYSKMFQPPLEQLAESHRIDPLVRWIGPNVCDSPCRAILQWFRCDVPANLRNSSGVVLEAAVLATNRWNNWIQCTLVSDWDRSLNSYNLKRVKFRQQTDFLVIFLTIVMLRCCLCMQYTYVEFFSVEFHWYQIVWTWCQMNCASYHWSAKNRAKWLTRVNWTNDKNNMEHFRVK